MATSHTYNIPILAESGEYLLTEADENILLEQPQLIDPNQDYDIIHTLTYASSGGDGSIRLYRGSYSEYSGTVYYRAGTSGAWTPLSVRGTSTTFPITSATMQIAHNWNRSGNNYMTPSFLGGAMTGIAISQKAVLSGVMGNNFMFSYAEGCTSLTSLFVPDTSGLTSVGHSFMNYYAAGCTSLTTLAVPDTSGLTSVGSDFMSYYADSCSNLTTLAVPDTSGLTSVDDYFMYSYAYGCSSLTQLNLPKVGWFKTHNVSWFVPSGRLNILKGYVPDGANVADWKALTFPGKTLYTNYIRSVNDIYTNAPPTQPIADFTATPTSGKRPVTVQFTDLTKGIPDTWSWNFGDGYTSTQQYPSHPYSKAGTYTVSLTASNSVGTDTVTKSALITIQPEVFSRTAGGTLLFGGTTARRLITSRTAGGTLLFGGETRAVVIRDAEAIQDKTYLYKVYDPDGNFIEVWKDVADEPRFTYEINSIGSSMTVELARNSDTVGTTTSPILDDDGQAILDDTELPILGSMETRNQIGAGTSVDYNNRVDIVAFYGSSEPLYDDDMDEILDDNDEAILTEIGAPNGRRIFTGFISEINSRYGNTESTMVHLTSYGFDLDQYAITTSYNNNTTTVPFNSFDPSEIARIAMDRFNQAANLEQASYTKRTTDSIATTGTQVSYTFRNNTYKEVLDKVLELMPSDWFYRVGLGDNTVYYRQRSNTPQHIFYLGKHIKSLDLKGSIMDVTNHVLFTGGGDPALYIEEKQAPAARTRRGLEILSDSRVTLDTSARIIAQGKIEGGNKMQNRSTIEILAKQYNIEEIQVGHVIGFRNFGNEIDSLQLIVAGLSYSPDLVQLALERKPPTVPKRLQDVVRNLSVQENTTSPATPS